MTSETIYTCSICGKKSNYKHAIEVCESEGKRLLLRKGVILNILSSGTETYMGIMSNDLDCQEPLFKKIDVQFEDPWFGNSKPELTELKDFNRPLLSKIGVDYLSIEFWKTYECMVQRSVTPNHVWNGDDVIPLFSDLKTWIKGRNQRRYGFRRKYIEDDALFDVSLLESEIFYHFTEEAKKVDSDSGFSRYRLVNSENRYREFSNDLKEINRCMLMLRTQAENWIHEQDKIKFAESEQQGIFEKIFGR